MINWNKYYESVKRDFVELKRVYPFASLTILPTVEPHDVIITVIAVSNSIIEAVFGTEDDFTGKYSKLLKIDIPTDYKNNGCKVYGGKWVDFSKIENKDIHFFHEKGKVIEKYGGYQMCVGTPESFRKMDNVILEAVKTADNTLVAYERLLTGQSKTLELLAYSHGISGRKEYLIDKKRWIK